jgi:hypothetical protein
LRPLFLRHPPPAHSRLGPHPSPWASLATSLAYEGGHRPPQTRRPSLTLSLSLSLSPSPPFLSTPHTPSNTPDKLAPTKAAERERKEAHKAELAAAKAAKADAAAAKASLFREERAASGDHTRRAAADERRTERKEKHAAGAKVCDHGVSRCRICFPPENGRKK